MYAVTIGDFNGDSRIDIIGSTASGADGWIFAGRGDGTFAAPVFVIDNLGSEMLHAAAGDFDGNGTRYGQSLDVFLNQGGLLFTPSSVPFATPIAGVTAISSPRCGTNLAGRTC